MATTQEVNNIHRKTHGTNYELPKCGAQMLNNTQCLLKSTLSERPTELHLNQTTNAIPFRLTTLISAQPPNPYFVERTLRRRVNKRVSIGNNSFPSSYTGPDCGPTIQKVRSKTPKVTLGGLPNFTHANGDTVRRLWQPQVPEDFQKDLKVPPPLAAYSCVS